MHALSRLLRWGTGVGFALLWCAHAACASSQDDDFLAARDAFRAGDAAKLERSARSLAGYILEPYIAYWKLRL
ncbi:MAG TPA: hypothetical protein VGQ54_00680, partial [Burkholderiales bacterium]|nr:hypothetical protein [Burkholderiales bacterium]